MAALPFLFDPTAIPVLCGYADLPDLPALIELKSRRQWVAWRYEERNGEMTKPPVSPRTGFGASHSNPRTWGSYAEAVARADRSGLAGVGYVISEDDDLTGADLDKCRNPETGELEPWAQAIVDLAETYCEVSPSGTGLRLIWRGKIDKTVKCDPRQVEIYRSQRYLTITGWHLDGTPDAIRPAPATLAALMARVEAWRAEREAAKAVTQLSTPSPAPVVACDHEPAGPGSTFFRAVNAAALSQLGAWVPTLFGSGARFQPGTGAYRVSSKFLDRDLQEDLSLAPGGIVDFGVHDMGDARDGKRTAIDIVIQFGGAPDAREAAFWLCERMGRTPADLGWQEDDGRGAELARQLIEARAVEVVAEPTPAPELPPTDLADELTRVPGLLGEIVDWITATARRPNRILALGAAITVLGTLVGRRWSGPTRSGTHLYILGLAPTGAGKEHPLTQVSRLMKAANAKQHIGPDDLISMPAVVNLLLRSPLCLCPMDEFGAFLKRVNHKRASGFEQGITKTLRSAWGKSFAAMQTPEWAGRQARTIHSPALSIFGVSTAEEFYGSLEGGDIVNGVLNRFLVMRSNARAADRDPEADPGTVPEWLQDALSQIYAGGNALVAARLNDPDLDPVPLPADWADERASRTYASMLEELERIVDRTPAIAPFVARTAEMAVRLATIRAIGRNHLKPRVDAADMAWGRDVAMWSARLMAGDAADYIAENENQAMAQRVIRIVKAAGGRITHRELHRRMQHIMRARDLKDLLQSMVEGSGNLTAERVVPPQGGTPSVWYRLADA